MLLLMLVDKYFQQSFSLAGGWALGQTEAIFLHVLHVYAVFSIELSEHISHLCRIYAPANRTSSDSDNGLSPIWRQAII